MPCNCDHLSANALEQEVSRVACLLDELDGKKWNRNWWNGYHPRVYGKVDREMGDQMTRQLCDALQARDVTQCSLEMQLWWRDHKEADKARCERDLAEAKTKTGRDAALAKLTQHERLLLGLKD